VKAHISLFSGIGGLDLAAERAGFTSVLQVERDPFCLKVLEKHWPDTRRIYDIREVTRASHEGEVTLISGGFPCQPFSEAGKRRGTADDRYLWPEMLRVVGEFMPSFVVAENVSGLLSLNEGMELEHILTDLEHLGYEVLPLHFPASGVGANHKRDRVFIVAHSTSTNAGGRSEQQEGEEPADRESAFILPYASGGSGKAKAGDHHKTMARTTRDEWREVGARGGNHQWAVEPDVGRVAHGVPNRVDRLRALGNAVVPQQAYPVFAALDT
jgi:DNA (cytosine-5)-methyltransferase 1